jgi:hypothetical protein
LFAVRMKVLKAALADDSTRLKLNLAMDWGEFEDILVDFARKHGFKVQELQEKTVSA